MGEKITVYGTEIELPEQPSPDKIEDWGEEKENQYWRRKKLPSIFKRLTYDKDGNIELTKEQEEFCAEELRRIEEGFWFYRNGIPTYISGRHYYYLQYWTLENKKAPEYRDVSRRYFLFVWHWRKVWWCLGVMRGKARRSGATSESSSNLTCEATTVKNSKCGIISKTSADARKVFIFRVQFGYRHLVFYLQPTLSNDKDSKSELVFNVPIAKTKKTVRAKLIDDVEGLNSMIDYQPTALNSYDSERLSYVLIDEGGKFPPDVPFSQFLSVISETLVEGSDRVGWAEIPSTVNEMTKKGGAEFKLAWDQANQFVINIKKDKPERTQDENSENYFDDLEDDDDEDEFTSNRFVRYYVPAYDGLAGFIDKYGDSIIENPTPQQIDFIYKKTGRKIRYGAKKYLENRRAKLIGAALEEEKRKYSFNEDEMFESSGTDCAFNSANINRRLKHLENNPIYKRKIIFYRDLDQVVRFKDVDEKTSNFYWQITALPPQGEENKFIFDGRTRKPGRINDGAIAVDGYSNSQGGRKYGSKASAWIGRKFNILDPENTGKPIGHLYGRPAEKDILHTQTMLAGEYYGYPVWYEHNADDYLSFYRDRGRAGYLGAYPLSTIDPTKRENADRFKGFPTTPFSLTKQLDAGIAYFEHYCDKIDFPELLENAKIFDPYNRTAFDTVVSFLILIVCLTETVAKPNRRNNPLVELVKQSDN